MNSDSSATSIAYGRALLELGILPADRVRAMGQHCLEHGLDLRQELLTRGLIDAAQDARVLVATRGPTAADASDAGPGSAGGSDTRSGKGLLPSARRLPAPGEIFGGLRVERELARGGMGAVFVATAPDGQPVALKVVLGDLDSGSRRERFQREAEIGENLRHPGIVQVLGHGEEAGTAYLVMELLEGAQTLDEYVRAQGVPLRDRVRLLVEVAEALGAAHEVGIFHRDLKPDNVLVTPAGQIKVVDFGLAKQVDRERLTQSGAVMGTLHYMAPEQVAGQTAHADARTDVFALGVILYELIRGERPFQGETGVQVMRAISTEEPPSLAPHTTDLPGLADVVGLALAKAPADRYPDAGTLARDLAAVLGGSAVSEAARSYGRRGRGRRGLLAALAVVLLAGVAGWAALRTPVLGADALEARARTLDDAAWAQLKREAPLLEDAAAIEALEGPLAELEREQARSRIAGVEVPDEQVARAVRRARALLGLLALARGDRAAAARAAETPGEGPSLYALRGAVAAVTTEADPAVAARELARGIRRGLARPELLRWRAEARIRGGLPTRTDAEEVLADLDALAARHGGTLAADEVTLRIPALIALGQPEEAYQALQALPDPSPELRWRVALARVELLLQPDAQQALAALAGLPPTGARAEQRQALAETALRLAAEVELPRDTRAPPRIGQLLRVARALAPALPLPRELADALLEYATGGGYTGDIPMALLLSELEPDDLRVQRQVGFLAERQGIGGREREGLQRALERAIELATDPSDRLDLEICRCKSLFYLGHRAECLSAAVRLLAIIEQPRQRAGILLLRAMVLRGQGDDAGALADLDEAIAAHEATVEQRPERARCLMALGRREEALQDAVRYFRAADEHLTEHGKMAAIVWEVSRETGQDDEARFAIERLVEWRPRVSSTWRIRLASLRLEDGDAAGAAAVLEDALALLGEGEADLTKRIRAAVVELRGPTPEGAVELLSALVESVE